MAILIVESLFPFVLNYNVLKNYNHSLRGAILITHHGNLPKLGTNYQIFCGRIYFSLWFHHLATGTYLCFTREYIWYELNRCAEVAVSYFKVTQVFKEF